MSVDPSLKMLADIIFYVNYQAKVPLYRPCSCPK